MRIAIGVEYNGRHFHGWQIQKQGERTVQGVLQQALSRVADQPVALFCAGRTDTGVHGIGQVAHFDTDAERSDRSWLLGGNVNLPDDVAITWVRHVGDDFHARFSARERAYRYLILNRGTRPALYAGRVTWNHNPLDAELMHRAGQALLGTQDFSSYRAVACQAKSPVRTLKHLSVQRRGDLIELQVVADGFLHHMVRNIAGVLMAIGRGEQPVDWAEQVLAARDRTQGGITAPAAGLYFARVGYDPAFGIPQPPAMPDLL